MSRKSYEEVAKSIKILIDLLKHSGYERIDVTRGDLEDVLDLLQCMKREQELLREECNSAINAHQKATEKIDSMHEDLKNAEEYAWKINEEKETLFVK